MGKAGRPTDYTPELADTICAELSEGKSLRTVCAEESMPHRSTVFRWLRAHEEFRDQYARAKEESQDALVEDIFDIADDGRNDWMEVWYGKNKKTVVNREALGRSQLRVDARKWYLSKIAPTKYGDHLKIDQTGEVTHRFEDMDDEQLDKAIAETKDQIPADG